MPAVTAGPLDGRFVLESLLGEDAVSEVWHATDRQLGRPVVIHVLHERLLDDEEVLERFRLEALAAARLNHGHVASLFDVVVAPEVAYTVGEYVDGPSLARLMEDGPLSPVVVAAVGHQAASGLAAAHEAGIIHRDVRPGNLLVGRDGRVRIVDFGSARIIDPERGRVQDAPTRSEVYLAPEQLAHGAAPTDRSDVFALGRTLLRALEGLGPEREPGDDGDDGGLLDRVMDAIPGLPLGTSLHDQLREQLAGATDPDPSRRPEAGELAASLHTYYDRRADEVLRTLVGRLPRTAYGRRPSHG